MLKNNRFFMKRLIIINLLLLLILPGCSHLGFPTYYDPTTYKSLTDLKPEITSLYDGFGSDTINTDKIATLRLRLAQIYEYENGKGKKNQETTAQVKIIRNIFERHVADRIKSGKWSEDHLNNNKQNIAQAFDIAIQTERLKNKNE